MNNVPNPFSGCITLGDPPDSNFSGQITLSAWVKLADTASSSEEEILAHGYSPTDAENGTTLGRGKRDNPE